MGLCKKTVSPLRNWFGHTRIQEIAYPPCGAGSQELGKEIMQSTLGNEGSDSQKDAGNATTGTAKHYFGRSVCVAPNEPLQTRVTGQAETTTARRAGEETGGSSIT